MTDPLDTALKEHSDEFLRQAVLPPGAVIVQRGRQRRRRQAAAPVAAATVLAVAGLALFIPQLSGRDVVRVAPDPAGVATGAEADMFGDDLVVVRGGSNDHLLGPVTYPDYPSRPPLVGAHAPLPQECGVYTEPIAPEHALHSLEHGAAWITYRPDLPATQIQQLSHLLEGQPHRLMSPLPGQESPIVLTAWTRQLPIQMADDPRVPMFLDYYANGPQTPEKGAACKGVNVTGATPVNE